MTTDDRPPALDRRQFLKGAATGAAAAVVAVPAAVAQSAAAADAPSGDTPVPAPNAAGLARDAGNVYPPPLPATTVNRAGSDLMVQTLKDLDIEFVAANPGSSFEGLQESVVNYGSPRNTMPEWITALHEETAVDMADGYGKATGKPMCVMLHGTIGLQHGSMAIYQAYYSRTPILLIAGRDDDFIQAQTGNDMGALVRSFTKWDAHPQTLAECLDALQEAYRQAITPPTGPALVVIDTDLQKQDSGALTVPRYQPPVIPGIDPAMAHELGQRLLSAANPRIAVGHLRTPEGVRQAIELAELVGASTSTAATSGPMSFPQGHPLCGPGASTTYDFTLGLEIRSPDIELIGPELASIAAERDRAGVGFGGLRANHRTQPFGRRNAPPRPEGRRISIDAEASLPQLISAVRSLRTARSERLIAERSQKHATANREAAVRAAQAGINKDRVGWDGSPISTARVYADLWPFIMNEDWCLASPSAFSGSHNNELWQHNRPYSYLGGQGAGGMGYGAGACAGAALAARASGRLVINVQTDGDLNYQPGMLWTAVHHHLPLLTIMHNNRAWHQELMFLEFMAGSRGRGTDRASIGSTLRDPYIDYRKMADAYGMAGEGPIEQPALLEAAYRRGVDCVKRGEPYLIDVITQPR
ncbi:MAG TPA: thiamine pyrophosphate-binding protein [Steroidobacteraceae bacterium]|jgi:thiamine pyrophosphate-dependent acetolactate synthase large subunit-like protein|nr:thiamine pyrophosphate-binding protein [Steroidobacteraceae bacterium]